jgi:serine protease Do
VEVLSLDTIDIISGVGDLVRQARDAASPSLVAVGGGWRGGSGVVFAPGLVLTSAHVLRRAEPTVRIAGGDALPARVAGVDVDGDIAVLAVDTGSTPPLPWVDRPGRVGDAIFALSALASGSPRITLGFVSALDRSFSGPRGRRIHGLIEHTAVVGHGSAGGPLVDAEGRLVGLQTVRLDGGLALALAADADLRARAEQLGRGEEPARRSLGVAVVSPRIAARMRREVGLSDRSGLLVRDVEESSPAAAAGIRSGDLIVAAAGSPVTSVDDIATALDTVETGELEIDVVRGEEVRSVRVTFDG